MVARVVKAGRSWLARLGIHSIYRTSLYVGRIRG